MCPMPLSETHHPKEVSLRMLKVRRFLYLFATILSSAATLIVLVCAAIQWIGRSDLFSADWWGGISYCFLAYVVLMIYFWMGIDTNSNAGWKIPLPDWMFYLGMFLLLVVLILLKSVIEEVKNAPGVLSFTTAVLFYASIFFFCSLDETNVSIREKTDPNFRRTRGF